MTATDKPLTLEEIDDIEYRALNKSSPISRTEVKAICSTARARIKALAGAEKIEEAFALLRKFSEGHEKHADPIGDSDLDDEQPRNGATLGDFRRARALLRSLEAAIAANGVEK